jgi:uncharacterized protein (DUF983 family)
VNITGLLLWSLLGGFLLLMASCAGFAAFAPAEGTENALFQSLAGTGAAVTLALGLLCLRQGIRELSPTPQAATRPTAAAGFECPRCGSATLVRLPRGDISPWREFRCEECGIRLANPSGRGGHAAVAVVAVGFLAFTAYMAISTGGNWRLPFGLGGVATPVLVYCAVQLARPVARRAR